MTQKGVPMAFFKRLFSRRQKPVVAGLRGVAPEGTLAEQGAMRRNMEADVAADRARRGATDARPGSQQPPSETPFTSPTDDA